MLQCPTCGVLRWPNNNNDDEEYFWRPISDELKTLTKSTVGYGRLVGDTRTYTFINPTTLVFTLCRERTHLYNYSTAWYPAPHTHTPKTCLTRPQPTTPPIELYTFLSHMDLASSMSIALLLTGIVVPGQTWEKRFGQRTSFVSFAETTTMFTLESASFAGLTPANGFPCAHHHYFVFLCNCDTC